MGEVFSFNSLASLYAMDKMKRAVVTGATSLIGYFLLPKLTAANCSVTAISRNPDMSKSLPAGSKWCAADIGVSTLSEERPYTLIHLAPLWLLPDLLQRSSACMPERVIAFSSTSRISKASSSNRYERGISEKLALAEDKIERLAEKRAIPWTIFRPTLIYGAGLDKNISTIARFIQRFGFFPLIGAATGKRMPVHAEDLAVACLSSQPLKVSYNKTYNLTGGEALSYQEMVERIFDALGKEPRYLHIPRWSLRWLLSALSLVPKYGHLTPEMASRMKHDLVFNASDARSDFDYCPRKFSPTKSDFISSR